MRYAKFLNNDNNKIELIAPSFGCTLEPYKSRLDKAIYNFKSLGFEIIEGSNIYINEIGYRSNTSSLCSIEFINAYTSQSRFILSVGGGNLQNEILDSIDFNYISSLEPKWFMGYSDNTNFTFVLTILCDLATIYGPCAPEFGQEILEEPLLDTIKLMKGEKLKFKGYPKFELESFKTEDNPFVGYNLDADKKLVLNTKEINIEGRLIGGCIDCLTYLVGTPYDKVDDFNNRYKNDGIIWFLEACDLEAWNLKLALIQMKRAGWFKNVKGFLIGRPMKIGTEFCTLTMENAVFDVLKDFNVPIILNADFGHLKPQIPIICGSIANIKAKDDDLEIEYILK